jgi:hypothetical protein
MEEDCKVNQLWGENYLFLVFDNEICFGVRYCEVDSKI